MPTFSFNKSMVTTLRQAHSKTWKLSDWWIKVSGFSSSIGTCCENHHEILPQLHKNDAIRDKTKTIYEFVKALDKSVRQSIITSLMQNGAWNKVEKKEDGKQARKRRKRRRICLLSANKWRFAEKRRVWWWCVIRGVNGRTEILDM